MFGAMYVIDHVGQICLRNSQGVALESYAGSDIVMHFKAEFLKTAEEEGAWQCIEKKVLETA